MIATDTNNKYYFNLYLDGNPCKQSEEYDSKIECLQNFCNAMKNTEKVIWGQFVCHHYADEWQEEVKEVILTLKNKD